MGLVCPKGAEWREVARVLCCSVERLAVGWRRGAVLGQGNGRGGDGQGSNGRAGKSKRRRRPEERGVKARGEAKRHRRGLGRRVARS